MGRSFHGATGFAQTADRSQPSLGSLLIFDAKMKTLTTVCSSCRGRGRRQSKRMMSRTLVTMLHQPVTSRGQPTGACPNDSTAVCWQLPPPVLDTRPGARGGGCEDGDVVDAVVDAAVGRRGPHAIRRSVMVRITTRILFLVWFTNLWL